MIFHTFVRYISSKYLHKLCELAIIFYNLVAFKRLSINNWLQMSDMNLKGERMLFGDSETESGNREQLTKTWRTSFDRKRGNSIGKSLIRFNSHVPQRFIQTKSWGDQGELRVMVQNKKKRRYRFKEYRPPSDEDQSAQIVDTSDGVIYYSTLYSSRLWKASQQILAKRYQKYVSGNNSSSDYEQDKMYQSDQEKEKSKKLNLAESDNQKICNQKTDQGENDQNQGQICVKDRKRTDVRYFESDLTGNTFRNAVKCFRCGKIGHLARRCIEERPPKKCFYCTKNHHYNLCESSAVCNKCGEADHIEYECDVLQTIRCKKCGQYGHQKQECGLVQFSKTKNFDLRKKIPSFNMKQVSRSDQQKLICLNNCNAGKGHYRCYRRSDIKGDISNIYPKKGAISYAPPELSMSSEDYTDDQFDDY